MEPPGELPCEQRPPAPLAARPPLLPAAPVYEELAAEFGGSMKFYKVDIDRAELSTAVLENSGGWAPAAGREREGAAALALPAGARSPCLKHPPRLLPCCPARSGLRAHLCGLPGA